MRFSEKQFYRASPFWAKLSKKKSFFIASCDPETAEILIILTWIELEKVILVISEILVLIGKSVSSKIDLETLS